MEKPSHVRVRAALLVLLVLTAISAVLALRGVFFEQGGVIRWPFAGTAGVESAGTVRLTYIERYTGCGDTVKSTVEVPSDEANSFLAGVGAEWQIAVKSKGDVELQKDVSGFCPEHRDYRFVVLYKATPLEPLHVCVFRGKRADPTLLVKERRDLDETALASYPREREALRSGIVVGPGPEDSENCDVDEKVDTYLQGIAEAR